jgi:hypothetical protein
MERTRVTIRYERLRRHFRPILEEWTKLICRYTEEYDPTDALYWYNERATLSTLAHAIVRKKSFVLEEYRMKKHSIHDRPWEGRADLFFVCGKTKYVAEAKQMWLSISSRAKRSRWQKRIGEKLNIAKHEAVQSKEHQGLQAIGVLFVVPYVSDRDSEETESLTRDCITQMSDLDYDAMAYAFPRGTQVKSKAGYLYPGVFCFIRVPKKT